MLELTTESRGESICSFLVVVAATGICKALDILGNGRVLEPTMASCDVPINTPLLVVAATEELDALGSGKFLVVLVVAAGGIIMELDTAGSG